MPRKPSPESPEGFEGARRMKHARYHQPQTDSRERFWTLRSLPIAPEEPLRARMYRAIRSSDHGAVNGMD